MSGWSILRSCFPLLGILLLDVSIGLSDDIVGKVIDGNGQPVSGARVDISTAGPKRGPAMYCPSCYLDCRKWAKTDLNGAFAIPDVDPNLKFSLLATATNKQTAFTDRIDPANGPTEIVMKELPETPSNRFVAGEGS